MTTNNLPTNLPEWATRGDTGRVLLDPERAYPHYLEQLDLPADKYGAEVARRCALEDLKVLCGVPLAVKIAKREAWALKNLSGTEADATRGANDFRRHYDALTKRRAARALAVGDL